jgi:hypothetical protein
MKTRTDDEHERPGEWLRSFAEDDASYSRLLADSENFAIAAYRLARARCRIQPTNFKVPNLIELKTAAEDIARRSGVQGVFHMGVLVADCALAGLTVILPQSYPSAAA